MKFVSLKCLLSAIPASLKGRGFRVLRVTMCAAVLSLLFSCDGILPQTTVEKPSSYVKPPIIAGETGGGSSGDTSAAINPITGNEGTWYQIFVWSWYDSNGDGIGDLKGITQTLDHLSCVKTNCSAQLDDVSKRTDCNKSMHVRGIWLTPIMPAPSYHRYDTTDYMNIEPEFGTIKDFEELVEECHKRGINIILDLAINHTGPGHKWFLNAVDEWQTGKLGKYAAYYNITTTPGGGSGNWHTRYAGKNPGNMGQTPDGKQLYFEGGFGPWMPELNWNNGTLLKEFEEIMRFWLIDKKVDGFRLDATKHIFERGSFGSGDTNKNVEYWRWFADTARSIKPTVFMVGETIDDEGTILEYHRPGMSSFAFPFSERKGRIAQAALYGQGKFFADGVVWWDREIKNRNPYATSTPLLTNHDHDRSSEWFYDDDHRKFAASLLLLMPGMPFIYYGDEIGLKGWKQGLGVDHYHYDGRDAVYRGHDDKFVRGPMIFQWEGGDAAAVGRPVGPPNEGWTRCEFKYPDGVQCHENLKPQKWRIDKSDSVIDGFSENPSGHGRPIWEKRGGVAEQLNNDNSLLRHYIKIQNMKSRYPWIAWGAIDTNGITVDDNGQVGAYRVTDNDPRSSTYGKSVVIAHNADRRTNREGYIEIKPNQETSGGGIGRPDSGTENKTTQVVRWEAAVAVTVEPGEDSPYDDPPLVKYFDESKSKEKFWIKAYTTVIFVEE